VILERIINQHCLLGVQALYKTTEENLSGGHPAMKRNRAFWVYFSALPCFIPDMLVQRSTPQSLSPEIPAIVQ
jgi:hypothetical protein